MGEGGATINIKVPEKEVDGKSAFKSVCSPLKTGDIANKEIQIQPNPNPIKFKFDPASENNKEANKKSDKMEASASIARMAVQELQTLQNPDQNAKWENDRMGANISRMARNKLQELQANKLKYEFRPASTSSTLRKVRKGLKAADQGPNSIEILYLEFRLEKRLEIPFSF